MKRTVLIALVLCFSQPGLAMAQIEWEDVYLKLGVGLADLEDADGTIVDSVDPPDEVNFDSENSASYQLGIGYKIDSHLTMELSLQHNSGVDLKGPYIDDGTLLAGTNGEVDLETTSVMMCALLDMATILEADWQLRPYIGLGLGYAKNKISRFMLDPPDLVNIGGNTENNFAWQATLGLTYPITEHFVLDVAYSYADYGDAESSRTATDEFGNTGNLNSPLTFDVKAQDIFLSVRYLF